MDRRHPSGRPRRETRIVARPIWRIPDDGYQTPRLRQPEMKPAIGFTVPYLPGADREELES